MIALKDQLFTELSADLRAGHELDEYHVQQRFVELILQAGLLMPEGEAPIVAVNANSGNPHYEPTSTQFSPIKHGDLVLFDFWGRLPLADAIYADYTWVAFAGTHAQGFRYVSARSSRLYVALVILQSLLYGRVSLQVNASKVVKLMMWHAISLPELATPTTLCIVPAIASALFYMAMEPT